LNRKDAKFAKEEELKIRVSDVGGFAFPDGVFRGKEVDAFVVVNVAVLADGEP
jgi:hypothetical protein